MKITKRQLTKLIREALLQEQGCADTKEKCVRKASDGTWYILNNKKGGIWKKGFKTKKSAEDVLKVPAVHETDKLEEELALFREGTLTFEPQPYGEIKILVDGQEKYLGELVADLLDAGDDDIFYGPQGINDKSLKTLLQYRATGDSGGPQGSMLYWDSAVFGDHYNVDSERVIRLWARRHNHQVEELEMERDEWDY